MKSSRTFKSRVQETVSVSLQVGALFCVLLTPLFFQAESEQQPQKAVAASSALRQEKVEHSLRTEIVALPSWGHEFWKRSQVQIQTSSSQIRFEISPQYLSEDNRAPASSGTWRIAKIKRIHSSEVDEELTLLADEFGTPISTTYLELFEARTQFEVVFKNSLSSEEQHKKLLVQWLTEAKN